MTWAAYLRVSTDKQTTENQEPSIRQLVEAREGAGSWTEGAVWRESASAVKQRPAFDALMEAARAGRFRRIYVWSLDRFGRSMFKNLRDLTSLAEWNVQVISAREPWIESTADPMLKKLLLAIFSWVAEHEHTRLKERTRAGLDRARAAGTKLGRPKVDVPDAAIARALELRRGRRGPHGLGPLSWREVARELKRERTWAGNHSTLARACTKRVLDAGLKKATKAAGF